VAGDIPTILAGQVSGLATVATSGAYGDLSGRPTLGTLAGQNGTFSGTSSGTNTGDQDLSGLAVKANNLSDLTNAATARSNLDAAGSGAIGSSGLTMATNRLAGRSTAGTGAVEEIILGTNLSFSGNTLNAIGGGSAASLVRIDTSTANTIYTGKAPAGTDESATGWTIKRTTYSTLGVRLTGPLTATGIWANRASLTYS
jgi:hypothetical protein